MSFTMERTIRMKLTPDERATLREQNAEFDLELERAKEKLDEAKADFKAVADLIKPRKKMTLQQLRSGFIEKNMEVIESADIDAGIIEYTDPETGQVVDSREMTTKEKLTYRQQSIPFGSN